MGILDILVGVVIAAISRRWYWAVVIGIALGVAVNAIFDVIAYADAFKHSKAMLWDGLSFSVCGLVLFLLKQALRKADWRVRKLDEGK